MRPSGTPQEVGLRRNPLPATVPFSFSRLPVSRVGWKAGDLARFRDVVEGRVEAEVARPQPCRRCRTIFGSAAPRPGPAGFEHDPEPRRLARSGLDVVDLTADGQRHREQPEGLTMTSLLRRRRRCRAGQLSAFSFASVHVGVASGLPIRPGGQVDHQILEACGRDPDAEADREVAVGARRLLAGCAEKFVIPNARWPPERRRRASRARLRRPMRPAVLAYPCQSDPSSGL